MSVPEQASLCADPKIAVSHRQQRGNAHLDARIERDDLAALAKHSDSVVSSDPDLALGPGGDHPNLSHIGDGNHGDRARTSSKRKHLLTACDPRRSRPVLGDQFRRNVRAHGRKRMKAFFVAKRDTLSPSRPAARRRDEAARIEPCSRADHWPWSLR